MTGGELLRTYAPHLYQAHLEWAGEDAKPATDWIAARMSGDLDAREHGKDWHIRNPTCEIAAKMAEPTGRQERPCPECGTRSIRRRLVTWACDTCGANGDLPFAAARADAFTDILSPAERAFVRTTHPYGCDCGASGCWTRTRGAMESSPHGGIIGETAAKGCPHSSGVPCAACILGIAPQNQYTQIDTKPEYSDRDIERGKTLGKAIGRL